MEPKTKKGTRQCVRVVARCISRKSCSKENQWHGLNGREKMLFLEAVTKQWNAWQENAAATVIPTTETTSSAEL